MVIVRQKGQVIVEQRLKGQDSDQCREQESEIVVQGVFALGQYIIVQTPASAIIAPTTSARSGVSPSIRHPHSSERTIKNPP
jgi:hypothetical protein